MVRLPGALLPGSRPAWTSSTQKGSGGSRWSRRGPDVDRAHEGHGRTPPGIETRLAWTVDDVDAAHAEFKEKGVDVDAAILRKGNPVKRWGGALLAGTPPMFVLCDPDGNSFLIG